jgi:hypothetical protein
MSSVPWAILWRPSPRNTFLQTLGWISYYYWEMFKEHPTRGEFFVVDGVCYVRRVP